MKKKKEVEQVKYGNECDIWSMGVVLYTMLYGQLPFRGNNSREVKHRVKKGEFILTSVASPEA